MAWAGEHLGAIVIVALAILAFVMIIRYKSSFRAKGEGLGGSFEFEGKNSEKAAVPLETQSKNETIARARVEASGSRSVAIGGRADGSIIVTGDSNKTQDSL